MNTEKIIIYTGLFGEYDNLTEPVFCHKNIQYICFTNNNKLKSKYWKIININEYGSDRYLNRKVKMLPHLYLKNYKKSIYIDANVILFYNPFKLCSYLFTHSFVLFQHPNKQLFLRDTHHTLL